MVSFPTRGTSLRFTASSATKRLARVSKACDQVTLAICQKLIAPEICSEYPWNVDRLANSLKYFTPRLALRGGNITFAAKPNALTL